MCKECGGKEIYALIWCWQHKCGVGKIKNNFRLIAPKCQRLAKEAQAKLFRLHRQVIEGDTETGGDCFWPTKFDGQRSVIGTISPVGITCTQIDMLGCF